MPRALSIVLAAAISLAKTFALEWAPRVAVTAVAPGYFPSRMTQPYLDDPEIARELRALIPAGRFGDHRHSQRT